MVKIDKNCKVNLISFVLDDIHGFYVKINLLNEITNEKTAASMAPRWILIYLLLCTIGFCQNGIFTDFIERDFCECKFDNDLKYINELNKKHIFI